MERLRRAVAHMQHDHEAAGELFLKALAVYERLAPFSPELAMTRNNLALVASARGDPAAAKREQLAALEIWEKIAPDSLHVARCLDNLGSMAQEADDPAVARELHQRALAIRRRLAPKSLDEVHSRATSYLGAEATEEPFKPDPLTTSASEGRKLPAGAGCSVSRRPQA